MVDDVVVIGQSVFWHGHLLGRDDIRVHVVDESHTLAPAFEGRASLVTVPSIRSVDDLTWAAGTLLSSGVRPGWVGVGSEMLQPSRGLLAAALGLSRPTPEQMIRTRDKRVMKDLAYAAGIPAAAYMSIPGPAGPDTIRSIVDRLGLPCVVKPVGGSGSARTYLCHSIAELTVALDRQQAPAMVESQVVGKEYHVDAVWEGDDPWIFTVSEYGVPPIELGKGRGRVVSMVHDPARRPELYADALSLCRRVNHALGITAGPTHLEFFETSDGLVFNEVGSRMAGGAFPSLVRVMCGTDLREVSTQQARGLSREELQIHAPRHPVTAMFNIAPPQILGHISALPDLAEIAAQEHVLHTEISEGVEVGLRIDPGADKGHPWGVLVIVGTDDTASVFELSEQLAAKFSITVE